MSTPSAVGASQRPFYAAHAAVYDQLITDPVDGWVDAVHQGLPKTRGLHVLDAGCGTGRHAQALIAIGYHVTILDASPSLLHIAQQRCPRATAILGDICDLPGDATYDAVACRGVLNDLTTDIERSAALASFHRVLLPGGALFLDVREADAAQSKADGRPRDQRVELEDGSNLLFTSRPTWRHGLIEVEERHELSQPDGTASVTDYHFVMRPWTTEELRHRLTNAGFVDVRVRPGVGLRRADRLFVTACRPHVEQRRTGVPARPRIV